MDERNGNDTEDRWMGAAGWNDTRRGNTADRIARAVDDLRFDSAQFPAWIKRASVKYDNHGNCEVTLVVPVEHRDVFSELGRAMRVPLLVTVEKFDGTKR